jgi:hypothetical protein
MIKGLFTFIETDTTGQIVTGKAHPELILPLYRLNNANIFFEETPTGAKIHVQIDTTKEALFVRESGVKGLHTVEVIERDRDFTKDFEAYQPIMPEVLLFVKKQGCTVYGLTDAETEIFEGLKA